MRPAIALAVLVGCAVATASAQSPSSTFARGSSQQSWQNPGLKSVLAKCKTPPPSFGFPIAPERQARAARTAGAARVDRDPRRDRRRADLEGRVALGGQQRRRSHRRRQRHAAVREQRREQRHAARSGDGTRHDRPHRHEHRRRVVAQQERRAVSGVERTEQRHRAARAAAQGVCELLPWRAVRLHRWRGQRPRRRHPRRRLRVDYGRRAVLRQPEGRRLAVRRRRRGGQRHHLERRTRRRSTSRTVRW